MMKVLTRKELAEQKKIFNIWYKNSSNIICRVSKKSMFKTWLMMNKMKAKDEFDDL